jgi:hypothetical protein
MEASELREELDPLEFCVHPDLVRWNASLGRFQCPICEPRGEEYGTDKQADGAGSDAA